MATVTARKPKKLTKADIAAVLNGDADRLMHLDLVGTAEAAEKILEVERARIGKWRRNGILLADGTRVEFPEPIFMFTTCAKQNKCNECGTLYDYVEPKQGRARKRCPTCDKSDLHATVVPDYTKLAASPLWWGDDIRELKHVLERTRPRN